MNAADFILRDAPLDLDLPSTFDGSAILDAVLIEAREQSPRHSSTIVYGKLERFRFHAINGLAQSSSRD